MRVVKILGALALLILFEVSAAAQTATTGTIVGAVTDPQAAAVGGATVELSNDATRQTFQQTTNASGQYAFPNVTPGLYRISVTMKGFRTSTIAGFRVDVAKSYNVDFKLELGELSEVVQVEAAARVELQTTDATVGNVISVTQLPRMPALTRQVNELLTFQPGATPTGEVTGARSDQSTFLLDGIDVTNNSIGGLNTYIFLPIDSIEEFRVGVANTNASFGRGAGGQVSLVGRSGTSAYHGAGYWYHQNDELNANSWENGHLKNIKTGATSTPRSELKDNRFGGNAGGPLPFLWSKKTFFFANYEGRRFPNSQLVSRLVPTDSFKQGILKFKDASGTVQSYPLTSFDPRGLGQSPTIAALFGLEPTGNDPGVLNADGLNTTGFTTNVGTPLTNDFYFLRLDQNVTSKWRADVSYRYFRQTQISPLQVNIIKGNVSTVRSLPIRQNMLTAGLQGQISSHLSGAFRFGWVRDRDSVSPERPNEVAAQEQLTGTNTPSGFLAIDTGFGTVAHTLLDVPIDVGTQVARKQANDNRNFQWNADMNWLRGTHTFQFGTSVRYLPTLHLRDDKVIGALGALVLQLDADRTNITIPGADRPPTCGGGTTANCLQSGDVERWDRLYAISLGLVDTISVLGVRDGSFKPLPFGSQLESDTRLWVPEFYFQDVWHLKPTLTLTLGVNYGWQTAPIERLGRQTVQIDAGTGSPITADSFLAARQAAAAQGAIFNPTFGFVPIKSFGGGVFNVDRGNIGPRVGVAWNPDSSSGFLGKFLGSRKTVIRSGFGIYYDRQNTVQSVIIPALGVGFAQTLNVTTPLCNLNGTTVSGCAPGSANPAASIFRVGQDGTLPVPTFPAQGNPVVPAWGLINGKVVKFPEVFSFQDDPTIKVGRNYAVDLTIQRELPGNMILEVGYAGRLGRKLPQSMSLGQSPFNFKDQASGQTFAQAFDTVATQIRNSQAVTPQPWFENQVPGGTLSLVSSTSTLFQNGNVSSLFSSIDTLRLKAGLAPFNNYLAQGIFLRSSTGTSNYHAMFVTLNKRISHGLQFGVNYTLSRSMDEVGAVQNSAGLVPNSFNLFTEYGPSAFDYRHTFSGTWLYELPFKVSNAALNRAVRGWYISGVFTALSGAPNIVTESAQVWGGTLQLGNGVGAVPTVNPGTFDGGVHSGVTTSPTGLNLFADKDFVLSKFRQVLIGSDGRSGRDNPVRGLGHWNLDTSIGKKTTLTERVQLVFSADFFNFFNHLILCDPGGNNPGPNTTCGGSLSLTSPASFGVLSTQFIPSNRTSGSRWIQLSFRVEF